MCTQHTLLRQTDRQTHLSVCLSAVSVCVRFIHPYISLRHTLLAMSASCSTRPCGLLVSFCSAFRKHTQRGHERARARPPISCRPSCYEMARLSLASSHVLVIVVAAAVCPHWPFSWPAPRRGLSPRSPVSSDRGRVQHLARLAPYKHQVPTPPHNRASLLSPSPAALALSFRLERERLHTWRNTHPPTRPRDRERASDRSIGLIHRRRDPQTD